jgi:hypothetical protein
MSRCLAAQFTGAIFPLKFVSISVQLQISHSIGAISQKISQVERDGSLEVILLVVLTVWPVTAELF